MPFEYFTQQGKEALDQAQLAARISGQPLTMPEHILVGVCESGSAEGQRLQLVLDVETFQNYLPRGPVASKDIPTPLWSPESTTVINHAVDSAQESGEPSPGCGSLLIGLARAIEEEKAQQLARILSQCGCTTDQLLEASARSQGERRQTPRRRRWEAQLEEEASQILRNADRDARMLHHESVEEGHLFLALLSGSSRAQLVLHSLNADEQIFQGWVKDMYPVATVLPAQLRMGDSARKIMETVSDKSTEAGKTSWNSIGLLTGLLEQSPDTQRLLKQAGITEYEIYRGLDKVMGLSHSRAEQPVGPVTLENLAERVKQMESRLDDIDRRVGTI